MDIQSSYKKEKNCLYIYIHEILGREVRIEETCPVFSRVGKKEITTCWISHGEEDNDDDNTYRFSLLIVIPVMHLVLPPCRNCFLHMQKRRFGHGPVNIVVFGINAERLADALIQRLIAM